jgi:hypothetical protein
MALQNLKWVRMRRRSQMLSSSGEGLVFKIKAMPQKIAPNLSWFSWIPILSQDGRKDAAKNHRKNQNGSFSSLFAHNGEQNSLL